jgi:hypothetical protein
MLVPSQRAAALPSVSAGCWHGCCSSSSPAHCLPWAALQEREGGCSARRPFTPGRPIGLGWGGQCCLGGHRDSRRKVTKESLSFMCQESRNDSISCRRNRATSEPRAPRSSKTQQEGEKKGPACNVVPQFPHLRAVGPSDSELCVQPENPEVEDPHAPTYPMEGCL